MALENLQTSITYQGTGMGTAFPVPFPVLDKSHLVVRLTPAGTGTPTLLAMGNDYSVALGMDGTGATVTLVKALADGAGLFIERRVPCTQENAFTNQGPNYPRVIESSLDKLTMIAQQLAAGQEADGGKLDLLDGDISDLARADAQLRDSVAALGRDKAERGELQTATNNLNNADTALHALITGLSQDKADKIHAARHQRHGKDPLSPVAIGALSDAHASEADPHPQYLLRGGSGGDGETGADDLHFFDFDIGGLYLRASASTDAAANFYVLASTGVSLKGVV